MGSPWCPVPQIHVWGAESPPKARAGVRKATRTQRRGSGPAQRDLVNRVRSGRKQLSAGPLVCRRVAWSEPATGPAPDCVVSTAGARSAPILSGSTLTVGIPPVARSRRYARTMAEGAVSGVRRATGVDQCSPGPGARCAFRGRRACVRGSRRRVSVFSFPALGWRAAKPRRSIARGRGAHAGWYGRVRVRRGTRLGRRRPLRREHGSEPAHGLLVSDAARPNGTRRSCATWSDAIERSRPAGCGAAHLDSRTGFGAARRSPSPRTSTCTATGSSTCTSGTPRRTSCADRQRQSR